jgi:hypothetical protein
VLHVKQAQIKIFSYLEGTHNFWSFETERTSELLEKSVERCFE